MTTQQPFPDLAHLLTTEEPERSIKRAERHSDPHWYGIAVRIVRLIAHYTDPRTKTLTADDVWEMLEHPIIAATFSTHDPRALGPVMQEAVRNGWIAATDKVVKSKRRVNHGRKITVWRSLLP